MLGVELVVSSWSISYTDETEFGIDLNSSTRSRNGEREERGGMKDWVKE